MNKVEEIEARRAKRKDAAEKARVEQYGKDLEAIDALEVKNGYELDISLRVTNFTVGAPSLVGVRAPSELEYKRFFQSVNRAGNADARMAAHELLANTCWVYPEDEEARQTLKGANPGLVAGVGNRAIKLGEMQSDAEGKG